MSLKEKNIIILIRKIITKLIIYFITSTIIFYAFNPKFIIYISFVVLIWIILIMNYKVNKNNKFILFASLFSIMNLASLIFTKCFVHNSLHRSSFNIIVSIIYLFLLVILFLKCICTTKNLTENEKEEETLYNRRKYDLDRLKDFIKSVNIIGINGAWGSGKSFLITRLKKDLTPEDYVFIDIDLLACDLDELQAILLNEMGKILSEHKIIPTYSNRLKNLFNQNGIYNFLYTLFMNDEYSYSESLNGFKQEVNLLEKTIIIVYEDIDRISNKDTIKKIFSISEKLSNDNIKVIYQYEYNNLQDENLDREYLEKYIPYVVNLTPISFNEVLGNVLSCFKSDEKTLSIKDFVHLTQSIFLDNYLMKIFNIQIVLDMNLDNTPTRKVKIFIDDLMIILEGQESFKESINKEVAINFLFLKHFFPELYNQFSIDKGLLDTIKFHYKDKEYTILELIAMSKGDKLVELDFKILFSQQENKEKLALLSIFKYNFEIFNKNKELDKDRRYEEIVNESTENITNKASNEKKDRLIWNLLCSGKSEYTDHEAITQMLIKDVLSKNISEQNDAYQSFANKVYHGNYEKEDNRTTILMGVPIFISLSQSLRASNVDDETWEKFLKFYFNYNKKKTIDIELIQVLNYCSLSSRKIYLYVLNEFNNLEIIKNMNMNKSYKKFLYEYLTAMSYLGYARTGDIWMLEMPEGVPLKSENMDMAVSQIKKILVENDTKETQKNLNIIINFIDKNIEIIKYDEGLT